MERFKEPAPFHVYCDTGTNFNGKPNIARLGAARDADGIRKLIENDKAAMGNTFGGLIAPVSIKGRTYGAFRATWEEVDLSTMGIGA